MTNPPRYWVDHTRHLITAKDRIFFNSLTHYCYLTHNHTRIPKELLCDPFSHVWRHGLGNVQGSTFPFHINSFTKRKWDHLRRTGHSNTLGSKTKEYEFGQIQYLSQNQTEGRGWWKTSNYLITLFVYFYSIVGHERRTETIGLLHPRERDPPG